MPVLPPRVYAYDDSVESINNAIVIVSSKISRVPLKCQAQDTILFTSAATNQRGCPRGSSWYAQVQCDQMTTLRNAFAVSTCLKWLQQCELLFLWRYVNCRDWESARRVAEQYDPSSVPDILIGSARSAFKDKDFQKAESYLLQAQKPEFAVQLYKVFLRQWINFFLQDRINSSQWRN